MLERKPTSGWKEVKPALCVMEKSVRLVLTKIKETSEVFFEKKIQYVVITVPSTMTSSPFRSYFRATLLFSSIEIWQY